jgi:hypothetical protein
VLVCVVAALLTTTGPAFYLAALLVLGVNRFFLSALSAALPHVVSRTELVMANSVAVTSGTVVAFVGAGVAYLLRVVFGAGPRGTALILLCSATAYVVSALMALTLGRDQLGPDRTETLTVISLHRFLYGITLIMAGLLYRNYFTASANAGLSKFVLFLALTGAGFFAGAVITPVIVRRIGKQTWIVALLGLAGFTVLTTFGPFREIPLATGGFLLGLVSQGIKISVDVIVQESVLDAYRGRVFSVYDMLFNGMFVAAAAVAAITLPYTGKSYPVLAALVASWALTAALYWLATRMLPPTKT